MTTHVTTLEDWQKEFRLVADFSGAAPRVTDLDCFRKHYLVRSVEDLMFHPEIGVRKASCSLIREASLGGGIRSASIEPLYRAIAQGREKGFTVPAINIRGLTFEVARAVFRAVRSLKAGPVLFELAKSEIGYTEQRPMEYAGLILAAALREGVKGPVFIQGDHYQANATRFKEAPEKEIEELKSLIQESIDAGYRNIDIDASTLVTLEPADIREQQRVNGKVTAQLTHFIRQISNESRTGTSVPISVGGEIGEVGKENSTPEELDAFMSVYREHLGALGPQNTGISKISVQTGTSHGGLPLPDGTIQKVALDFDTLSRLSRLAREKYGMGGAVQHGASTLPEDLFDRFPGVGTLEIHLATGFQNLILDHPRYPKELTQAGIAYLKEHHAKEWKKGETEEQFIYKNRKRLFGPFKKELFSLPPDVTLEITKTLEERFVLIFRKLGLEGTREVLERWFP